MLVLTRRLRESIIIGNNITVTILGIEDNLVRVGVDAPRDIPVHREEIQNLINNSQPSSNRNRIQK